MLTAAAAISAPAAMATSVKGDLLTRVEERGAVVCGVAPSLPGFSMPDSQGRWAGLDVDLCRGLAAAIFDDPMRVTFVPLSSQDRFTALQTGEVDLLSRSSTWSMTRDTGLGLRFAGVNFYGGEGFMVRKALGIASAGQLGGATVCAEQGTTTELNVADFFRRHGLVSEIVTYRGSD